MQRSPSRGFTLVELMVVVVIVTILSTLAVAVFKKFTIRARVTEVYAMFAEIRAKEESYRAEFTSYLSVSANDSDFYPVLGSAGGEPMVKSWAPAPAGWTNLGVNPPRPQLYCSYAVVAGQANDWGTAGNAYTQAFFSGTPPAVPWWAAVAMCDNDGVAGSLGDGNNAQFITSSRTTAIREDNPNR